MPSSPRTSLFPRAVATAALLAGLAGLAGCGGGPPAVSVPEGSRVGPPPAVSVARAIEPVGEPIRVTIPAIDVDERLHGVGLQPSGAMETPDFGDAGWYDLGPRPGAPGPAVIVAHVHGPQGDDVFARLHELRPGDRVTVERTDGVATFVVDSIERASKTDLPYDRIWSDTDRPVLRLITCGGTPDPVTRSYPDNTIVFAALAPAMAAKPDR